MIFDVHGHCGYSFFPIDIEWAKDIINLMDRYDIERCILANFRGIFYEMEKANEEVELTIRPYKDRLYGYIVANPNYIKKSLEDIEHFSKIPGFIGVKLHPAWHQTMINDEAYSPIFELCNSLNLPILVHSFISESIGDHVSAPERLSEVAAKYENPIILGHMGGNHRRGIKAAKGIQNLFLEISGGRQDADSESIWIPERVEYAIHELGVERILFGSDLPLVDPAISIGIINDSKLTVTEKQAILFKNAERIFFTSK